jgi:hypothetical protein
MSLQMQLRRGVLALVIGFALVGLAVGRAHFDSARSGSGVGAVIRAVDATKPGCDASLRIELARAVHLTVPCDSACAPMRGVLHTLHVAAEPQLRCTAIHTA